MITQRAPDLVHSLKRDRYYTGIQTRFFLDREQRRPAQCFLLDREQRRPAQVLKPPRTRPCELELQWSARGGSSNRKAARGKVKPIILEMIAMDSNAPIADTGTANDAVVSDPFVAHPAASAITASRLGQVTEALEEGLGVDVNSFHLQLGPINGSPTRLRRQEGRGEERKEGGKKRKKEERKEERKEKRKGRRKADIMQVEKEIKYRST